MATLPKFVLITGCSEGGIGDSLATVFQEKGYHVFATARNVSKISKALSDKANVTVMPLDVLSSESIAAAVERVNEVTGGRLDVLVNNSGATLIAPALDTPMERAKYLMELNFWAPVAMLHAFSPLLIQAQGCMVNNTSANAVVPMPLNSVYNASKAALAVASDTWRLELQPLGVRVMTLITGGVKTKLWTKYDSVEIPPTSHYYKIQDFIKSLADGRLQNDGMDAREYAMRVVREIERGAVGDVWVGGGSNTSTKWALSLSPRSVRDKMLEGFLPFAKEMAKAK
ncbi:short-chain dehydrogenase/reductase [Thozetella sp. PMI_491]|nr:short-chain dehydrogenase/reductase [Thozetella sp. PMI_491]